MEYCGLRQVGVKASSRSGRSRKGNTQKPKKAHSRRRCYKTSDASLNSGECIVGASKRCVIRGKNPEKLEARRSKVRAQLAMKRGKAKTYKYSFKIIVTDVANDATYEDVFNWYKEMLPYVADALGYKSVQIDEIPGSKLEYLITVESENKIDDAASLERDADTFADPDTDGNELLLGELVKGALNSRIREI